MRRLMAARAGENGLNACQKDALTMQYAADEVIE
jgi:hypothetical protein